MSTLTAPAPTVSAATFPFHDEVPDEELVAGAMAGNDAALGELLRRYRDFVRFRAHRLYLPGAERADLIQEGMIGLYRAIVTFDPAGERDFRPYADVCVRRHMLTAISAANRLKASVLTRALRPDGFHPGDDSSEVMALTTAEWEPERIVITDEERALLARFLRSVLTDFESEVLGRYLQGDTYQQIAAALARPVKAVDNALHRVRRKVAEFIARKE